MATQYNVTGTMVPAASNYTLNLTATPQGGSTPAPEPPPTLPPPAGTTVITPSGGDDTGKIQDALNSLASGYALQFSGKFLLRNTLWVDGVGKILTADPSKPSGFLIDGDGFNGHYGSALCTSPNTAQCRIQGLEFDGRNHQTQMVFFDGGHENLIDGCFLHGIAYNPSGPPYAAIHSQNAINLLVRNCRIENTTGIEGGEGVRGVWLCGGSGLFIIGCTVDSTGHTAIITEGSAVLLLRNIVSNSLTQGTGMKVVYRDVERPGRVPTGIVISQNVITNTVGAGVMLENIDDAPGGVLVEGNKFVNCGKQGSSFGAIYSSDYAANVVFRANKIENCRSVAGLRNAKNWLFEQSTIVGPGDAVNLEDNCHDITLDHSGRASVGSNCSNVKVDGAGVA